MIKKESNMDYKTYEVREYKSGTIEYRKDGNIHRDGGPAIEYNTGNKYWFKDGLLHREDGPAVEKLNGDKKWYKYGKLHREDGPACEYSDGNKYYYLNDVEYSNEEYCNKIYVDKLINEWCNYINVPSMGYKLDEDYYKSCLKRFSDIKSYNIKGKMFSEDTIHEALKYCNTNRNPY